MTDDTRTTIPTHSITLTASELTDLVAPVIPHASTDQTLPLLRSVRVTVRDGWVLAAATDRYRLACKRVRPQTEPDPEFAAVIQTPVLARVRAIFKATRHIIPTLTLTVEGDVLTVQSVDGLDGITIGARLAYTLPDKPPGYPNIDKILRQAITGPVETPQAMQVNHTFLSDFKIGQSRYVPLIATATHASGDRVNWLIRCGEDFIGVIVPVFGGPHLPDAGEWLSLLDAPAPTAPKVEDAA